MLYGIFHEKIPGWVQKTDQTVWACDPFTLRDDVIEFTSNFNLQVSLV